MKRSILLTIGSLVAVLLAMIVLQLLLPKRIDWSDSFSKNDKIPSGCSLLFDVLPGICQQGVHHVETQTLYEACLEQRLPTDHPLLIISDNFEPDPRSMSQLLSYVRNGGCAFIVAGHFPNALRDSLGFDYATEFYHADSTLFSLSASNLKSKPTLYHARGPLRYFDSLPAQRCEVLGSFAESRANFIRIREGKGTFYLNSQPHLFDNYALSSDSTSDYACAALSYLPASSIIWDEYYKPNHHEEGALLRVLFRDSRLRIAYYICLALVLFFIVFHTKRRERAIPVQTPPANATVDFVRTVGQLYYEHRDSSAMIRRMVQYFMEELRTKLYMSDLSLGAENMQRIAQKTALPLDEVQEFFRTLQHHQANVFASDKDVIATHKLIQDFRHRAFRRS